MSGKSTASFIEALRLHGLLEPSHWPQLDRLRSRFADPRALGQHLLRHGWLTAYQVNLLLQGRAAELVLGPYVLLDRLGEGGNGQVFRARHRTLNRTVALKIMRPELAADAETVGRFHREIELVSQVSHPNIVHAFDAGPIGAALVLAMELVEGHDLDRQVRMHGPLPVAVAAEYIRQAAQGLQHAHENGLIHRDIKPANLLVSGGAVSGESSKKTAHHSTTHQVKILDLGLARLSHSEVKSATANLTLLYGQEVTQGTPDYMAPEQALDFHAADTRADIYSLGCTFFFLLRGAPPFPGGSLAQKLMQHQQVAPPAIQQLRPEVPAALGRVLDKMLAKRVTDRFQTPGEVADALAALFANGTIPAGGGAATQVAPIPLAGKAPPAAPVGHRLARAAAAALRWGWSTARRRPRLAVGLAGTLLLGLAVVLWPFPGTKPLGGVFATSETAAIQDVLQLLDRAEADEAEVLQRLTRLLRKHPGSLPSLRAELLAVGIRSPGSLRAMQARVWLTYLPSPLDLLNPSLISEKQRFPNQPAELVAVLGDVGPTYGRVAALAFRPDATLLAVSTTAPELHLWDVGQATPQRLPGLKSHRSYVFSLAISPDGKWLASGGGDNSATGDNTIRLWDTTLPEIKPQALLAGHTSTVNTLAFAPDGQWLASSGEDQSVRLWDLGSREGKVIAPRTSYVRSLAYAPDGRTLAVAGNYAAGIRLLDLTPPPGGHFADLKFPTQEQTQTAAYAPDGKTLASHSGKDIVLWDPARLAELTRLKGHTANVNDLVYHPDGRALISADAAPESQTNVNDPEGVVIRWSLASQRPAATWRFPCGGVKRLALASDGRHLAVGGRNSLVYILRLAPPKVNP